MVKSGTFLRGAHTLVFGHCQIPGPRVHFSGVIEFYCTAHCSSERRPRQWYGKATDGSYGDSGIGSERRGFRGPHVYLVQAGSDIAADVAHVSPGMLRTSKPFPPALSSAAGLSAREKEASLGLIAGRWKLSPCSWLSQTAYSLYRASDLEDKS